MDVQSYLIEKFQEWQPSPPAVVDRTKRSITLDWSERQPFGFLAGRLLYRVEKDHKLPKWVAVYSGGKSTKMIDNLAPRHPHTFRLKVILKTTDIPRLAKLALEYYGDENIIYEKLRQVNEKPENDQSTQPSTNDTRPDDADNKSGHRITESDNLKCESKLERNGTVNMKKEIGAVKLVHEVIETSGDDKTRVHREGAKWIESRWSDEVWTSTDTDGTSPMCFCMAVKCGYLKEIQTMCEERPELVAGPNPASGLTPLATAVRGGDINTVRFLLTLGAEVDQTSLAGQTPLHLAVLAGDIAMVQLLREKGADPQMRDWNGLRMEHFAVDSGSLDMLKYILDAGGDVHVKDSNGWSPLFRARRHTNRVRRFTFTPAPSRAGNDVTTVCQQAGGAVVGELLRRGSDARAVDGAGLSLRAVAELLTDARGRRRDSITRLIDAHCPHEKALANFTKLTKKIYNVHTLLKLN